MVMGTTRALAEIQLKEKGSSQAAGMNSAIGRGRQLGDDVNVVRFTAETAAELVIARGRLVASGGGKSAYDKRGMLFVSMAKVTQPLPAAAI